MVSEEEMRKIMRGVRAIGPNNAGVQEAAHLLAEAMKEGVEWEGEATVKHEWRWEDGEHIVTAGLHFDELPPGWMLNVPDGQRVTVTVTREGMGDGEGD